LCSIKKYIYVLGEKVCWIPIKSLFSTGQLTAFSMIAWTMNFQRADYYLEYRKHFPKNPHVP